MSSARKKLFAAILFFLLVASLRLCLISLFGFDSPYSDQWDESWTWLRPFQNGRTDWNILFAAHNEHRIALTRLVSLALFAINSGQSDNLVWATFDALLVAALGAVAFRTMLDRLEPVMWTVPAFLLVACLLPCGYENLLIGFQLQFYLLIALAVFGVWIAASRTIDLKRTLLLGLVAYASLFTMASGLLASLAIAVAAGLRLRSAREPWLPALPLFALLCGALIFGDLLLVHTEQHLQAQNISEWLTALRKVASWPLPATWLSVAVLWSPLVIRGVAIVRARELDVGGIAALTIGAWTAAQIGAIAYGRGHEMGLMPSRYTDVLALGVLVNAYFCMSLLRPPFTPDRPGLRVTMVCIWLTAIAGGYAVQGLHGAKAMQDFAASRQLQSQNVRTYVLGTDRQIISTALPWNLPYPDRQRLKMMLDDKTMRQMLPAGARMPIPLGAYDGGFNPNGLPDSFPRPQGRGAYGSYEFGKGNDNMARKNANGLHSRFPYLLFYVAGDLGLEGITLQLQTAEGTPSRSIGSGSGPSASWKEVIVATPSNDFGVQAVDESHDHWFAFAPPLELGRLSACTHSLLDVSPQLLLISLLTTGFTLLFWCMLRLHAMDFRRSEPRLQADSVM